MHDDEYYYDSMCDDLYHEGELHDTFVNTSDYDGLDFEDRRDAICTDLIRQGLSRANSFSSAESPRKAPVRKPEKRTVSSAETPRKAPERKPKKRTVPNPDPITRINGNRVTREKTTVLMFNGSVVSVTLVYEEDNILDTKDLITLTVHGNHGEDLKLMIDRHIPRSKSVMPYMIKCINDHYTDVMKIMSTRYIISDAYELYVFWDNIERASGVQQVILRDRTVNNANAAEYDVTKFVNRLYCDIRLRNGKTLCIPEVVSQAIINYATQLSFMDKMLITTRIKEPLYACPIIDDRRLSKRRSLRKRKYQTYRFGAYYTYSKLFTIMVDVLSTKSHDRITDIMVYDVNGNLRLYGNLPLEIGIIDRDITDAYEGADAAWRGLKWSMEVNAENDSTIRALKMLVNVEYR